MRRKWDNPAMLTVNFAFDTRLLDLVANTYQQQKQETAPQSRQKRSHSQKNLQHQTPRKSIPVSLFQPQKSPSPSISKFSKSLSKKQEIFNTIHNTPFSSYQNQQPNNKSSQLANSSLNAKINVTNITNVINTTNTNTNANAKNGMIKIAHINRNNLNPFQIEEEMNKKMLKNIRKNILSTNMTQDQLLTLENTYKQILKKVRK